jgi:outer membrane protein
MSFRMALRPLFVCSALLAGSHAFAQPKIAVVNMQQAVFATAEIKKADADLQATMKPRTDAAGALQTELQGIAAQLQQTPSKLTPQQQEELSAEGQRKQRDLQRMQQDLTETADAARQEIIPTITKKMVDVVKKLAEEKGFDVVSDTANLVYFKAPMDITTEAIAAYDKTYPVAAPKK